MLQPGQGRDFCTHFFFASKRFIRFTRNGSESAFVPIASAQRMIHGREVDILNVADSVKRRAGTSDEIARLLTLPCTLQDIIAEIKGRRDHGSSGN